MTGDLNLKTCFAFASLPKDGTKFCIAVLKSRIEANVGHRDENKKIALLLSASHKGPIHKLYTYQSIKYVVKDVVKEGPSCPWKRNDKGKFEFPKKLLST